MARWRRTGGVPEPTDDLSRRRLAGALAGLLAAFAALAAAELAAVFVRPEASPVVAVGDAVVDATPTWLREWAITQFGTNDKHVLVGSIFVLLALLSLVTGALAVRRRAVGLAGVAVLGLVGAVAAATRPDAEPLDPFPSLVGAVIGAMALILLLRPVAAGSSVATDDQRRQLLVTAAWIGAASVLAGSVGRAMNASKGSVAAARAAVRLPAPATPAPPVPAGSELKIPGLSPFTTPTGDFYRIDTALIVPQVSTDGWRLRVHGMVDREVELDFAQLLGRPMVERDVTLTCVSNEVGGNLAGNARWLGAPLAALLEEVGVDPRADMILSRSKDGMTIGTPTAVVMDGRDAMLAVGMNGQPLPAEHGFPVRMVVPGLYGYVSATKWLVDLELTTFDRETPYWVARGWVPKAPIRTASRIDTPRSFTDLRAGRVAVAGVAWAQHRGIAKVEVRVDGGSWAQARLAEVPSADTWRQWVWEWAAMPGRHVLEVRATDADEVIQPGRQRMPFPSGATGWHTVEVSVS
jgi:DMSO/TMAO reductase YedYZ molybdopterin-dependent catalytic subunit